MSKNQESHALFSLSRPKVLILYGNPEHVAHVYRGDFKTIIFLTDLDVNKDKLNYRDYSTCGAHHRYTSTRSIT